MITRKVRFRNGSYLVVIPKLLAELLGLKQGQEVGFKWYSEKILITPVTPQTAAKTAERVNGRTE